MTEHTGGGPEVEEMITVLSPAGEPTGVVKPKRAVHSDGDWHRAVHVWILTPQKELLLQRRALSKKTYPGLWDISCAGHVSAGESPETAAVRELEEELGIDARESELELLGILKDDLCFEGHHYEREFQHTYLLRRDVVVRQLILQPGEVDDVALVSLDDFEAGVARRDATLAPHWRGYELLLYALR